MKRKTRFFSLMLSLLLLFGGCAADPAVPGDTGGDSDLTWNSDSADSVTPPAGTDLEKDSSDMFTDRDYEIGYDTDTAVRVQLSGTSATASSDAVRIKGSTVMLTEEATYILTGTLTDGMIVVDAPDTAKVQIVLDGVNITKKTSAPLYILEADKVFVTLAAGTENVLSAGDSFTAIDDSNIDAAVFSKQDVTFNGTGTLTVLSPAGHGIVSKDDLVITGGTYTVESASHGIDANDSVRITGAAVTVKAGKDGIHAENSDDTALGFVYIAGGTFDITAEGDGISAGAHMQIGDGTFSILAGGGHENGTKQSSDNWGTAPGGMGGFGGRGDKGGMGGFGGSPFGSGGTVSSDTDESGTSMKGVKAAGSLLIAGGTFTIDSADDAVHSNTSVTVNGGTFDIATGDDGFHADDTLTVTAGTIRITESYEGMEGLHIAVQGGTVSLKATDDGLNAAGGTDQSGFGGRDNGTFGGGRGGMGGFGGMSSGNGSIVISGGDLFVNASGDGIDANGTLEITGGHTVVCGPTRGDTATLDYDKSAVISGGTFIGTGASGMAQTFSGGTQGIVSLSVGNQSADTEITLKDAEGRVLLTHSPILDFAVVILSSPELMKGESYTVTVGTASGDFTAN